MIEDTLRIRDMYYPEGDGRRQHHRRESKLRRRIHTTAHLLRAAQEGIACSFRYGIDIMRSLGLRPDVIRAGRANLFLSPLFRRTLATLTGARIELFDTDGALGAARGAALGAGLYKSREEAFASLKRLEVIEPEAADREALEASYERWKQALERRLS